MIYLFAASLLLLAGVIALQARALDRDRSAFAAERREWAAERRDLNNRIQVPQAAPFMPTGAADEPETPQYVPFDDDDAFQANRENGWQS